MWHEMGYFENENGWALQCERWHLELYQRGRSYVLWLDEDRGKPTGLSELHGIAEWEFALDAPATDTQQKAYLERMMSLFLAGDSITPTDYQHYPPLFWQTIREEHRKVHGIYPNFDQTMWLLCLLDTSDEVEHTPVTIEEIRKRIREGGLTHE